MKECNSKRTLYRQADQMSIRNRTPAKETTSKRKQFFKGSFRGGLTLGLARTTAPLLRGAVRGICREAGANGDQSTCNTIERVECAGAIRNWQ